MSDITQPKFAADALKTLQRISLEKNPLMAPAFMEMPPSEILNAANLITNWFQEQGIHEKWQLLGICHRGFAYENEDLKARLIAANDQIIHMLEKDLRQMKVIEKTSKDLMGLLPEYRYVLKEEPGK